MSNNRLELVSADLWKQLAAAGEFKQHQVAEGVFAMALEGCHVAPEIVESVRRAVYGQQTGDTPMRQWLKQMADQATAAELDAEELDDDKTAADLHWRAARLYEVAYWVLDPDRAEGAGEATYEAAQLLDEGTVLRRVRQVLAS
ncbi:hypothetical protein [Fodinicola acaciae]|uniref:hypothetical protein n=1 Tax=Fodinicola acaciae TaxID=2681555 RepID=UPI0013D40916|nr:hypothetical protein [Fodinicola acaciae]